MFRCPNSQGVSPINCFDCIMRGFCARWLVVTDHELQNPAFIDDARAYTREWMNARGIAASELIDAILVELSKLDGNFKNEVWVTVVINWSDLFEVPEGLLFLGTDDAPRWRSALLDWISWNFHEVRPESSNSAFHGPISKARFIAIASSVRAINWGDTNVRHWGLRAANDNEAPG